MKDAGISSMELAAFLKLKTSTTVDNWCDGVSEPRASQLGAISAAVGKSVSWLLGFASA